MPEGQLEVAGADVTRGDCHLYLGSDRVFPFVDGKACDASTPSRLCDLDLDSFSDCLCSPRHGHAIISDEAPNPKERGTKHAKRQGG
jgi:hypothetical protein